MCNAIETGSMPAVHGNGLPWRRPGWCPTPITTRPLCIAYVGPFSSISLRLEPKCALALRPLPQKSLELIQIEEAAIQELKALYAAEYAEDEGPVQIYRIPYGARRE